MFLELAMNMSRISIVLITALAGFIPGQAAAATFDIAEDPLFLVQPVKPAMIMAIDDSGSMDGEMIMPTNDGAMWWHTGNESFTGLGVDASVTNDVPET